MVLCPGLDAVATAAKCLTVARVVVGSALAQGHDVVHNQWVVSVAPMKAADARWVACQVQLGIFVPTPVVPTLATGHTWCLLHRTGVGLPAQLCVALGRRWHGI